MNRFNIFVLIFVLIFISYLNFHNDCILALIRFFTYISFAISILMLYRLAKFVLRKFNNKELPSFYDVWPRFFGMILFFVICLFLETSINILQR